MRKDINDVSYCRYQILTTSHISWGKTSFGTGFEDTLGAVEEGVRAGVASGCSSLLACRQIRKCGYTGGMLPFPHFFLFHQGFQPMQQCHTCSN